VEKSHCSPFLFVVVAVSGLCIARYATAPDHRGDLDETLGIDLSGVSEGL
jgi:hypothetical protein